LTPRSHCNSNQAASSSVGRLVTPRCIRRVVAGPGVLTELTLRRYHRYWSAARARLAGSRAAGVGSPALAGRLLAMAGRCAGAPAPLAGSQPSGLHWWLGRLRWRRITLAEVRILRFAICDELQIDLWLRFVARRGCGVPRMTGAMQSRKRPSPALALPCTNPACSQAALISAQGPWRGAACTETAAPKPTINVPRMPPQNFTPGVRFQRLAQKVPPRDASLRLRRGLARPI